MNTTPPVVVEDLWIELPTGIRLAARRWYLSEANAPAPTIFEHLPYRLSDFRAGRDNSWYSPLAAAGYVGLRVDIRGTGNSGGFFDDEYSAQELDDAEAIIEWIRNQPWSDGTVGMIGISYSGFNALQLGTRNPTGLKAIIAAGFADDRFDQDVHRIGGGVHDQGLSWAQMCMGIVAFPPDPLIVGEDRWLGNWEARLDALKPPVLNWLSHQRKDDYWSRESARNRYGDMTCAVYAVSGWNDRYRDGVLSLMSNYGGPKKGLIGPWEHAWPQEAGIGPRLDFIPEAIRWFDHWLKGAENGVMDQPALHAWVEDSAPPSASFRHQSGRWVALDCWRSEAVKDIELFATSRGLELASSVLDVDTAVSNASFIGLDGGVSAPFKSAATDLARNQRAEDGRSTTFDTKPLSDPFDILGHIEVDLTLISNAPLATLSARLCDIFPDGTSRLISVGLLNLAMRESSENPVPLPVDEPVEAKIVFQSIGYRIPAGHKIRLSISANYWPWLWPSPANPDLTLPAGSRVTVRVPQLQASETLPVSDYYGMSTSASTVDGTWLAAADPDENSTSINLDLGSGRLVRRSTSMIKSQPYRSEGAELTFRTTLEDHMVDGDPLSVVSIAGVKESLERGLWRTSVEARTRISCDSENFFVEVILIARHGDDVVRDMEWHRAIPRDHV